MDENLIKILSAELSKTTDEKLKAMIIATIAKYKDEPETRSKTEIRDWNDVVPQKFRVFKTDPALYKIEIDGREIAVSSEEILNSQVFRRKFFDEFGIMLPIISQNGWAKLITDWRTNYAVIEQPDAFLSEKNEIVEMILDYVKGCREVSDLTLIDRFGTYFIDPNDNSVLVSSFCIKEKLQVHNLKITMRKLREVLEDWIVGNSRVTRCGSSLIRCWAFKPEIFGESKSKLEVALSEED